jgi:hypothetical protein
MESVSFAADLLVSSDEVPITQSSDAIPALVSPHSRSGLFSMETLSE